MKKTIIIILLCIISLVYLSNAITIDTGYALSSFAGSQTSKYCTVLDIKDTDTLIGNYSWNTASQSNQNCYLYYRGNKSLITTVGSNNNRCNFDTVVSKNTQVNLCVGTTSFYQVGYNSGGANFWTSAGANQTALNFVCQQEIDSSNTWLGNDRTWTIGWQYLDYTVVSSSPPPNIAPNPLTLIVNNATENTTNLVNITKGSHNQSKAVTFMNLTLYNATSNISFYTNYTTNFTQFTYTGLRMNNSYYVIGWQCDEANLCNNGTSNIFTRINFTDDITIIPPTNTTNTTISSTTTSVNLNVTELADALKGNTGSFELIGIIIIFVVLLVIGVLFRAIIMSLSGGFLTLIALYFMRKSAECTYQNECNYYFGVMLVLFLISIILVITGVVLEIISNNKNRDSKDFYKN